MILGKRLINTGVEAACTTDTADVFGDSSGVALYTLDYDASDASGNYDGTPTNVEFGVDGQINYGARFNGSNSKIDIGSLVYPVSLKGTIDELSISLWFKSKSAPTSNEEFLTWWSGDVYGDVYLDGFLGLASGNTIRFGDGWDSAYTFPNTNYVGNWTHIVAIKSSTNAYLYINGSLVATKGSALSWGFNRNLIIGGDQGGGEYFNGQLDQIRLFDKALSSSEVSTLYAEAACVYTCTTDTVDYPTTNVAYYKLDNSAIDEKGSYDGTETNISYTFGRFGQAAVFNGSSSYIQTSLSLANTAGVSTSFWFQADTVGSTNIALYFNNNGGRIDININGTGSNSATVSSNVISVNSTTAIIGWNHLAIVYTGWASSYTPAAFGGAISAAVYLNGSLIGTVSPTPYGQTDGLRIGRSGGSYYFDGKIDQVRIFSSALDSTQVTQLYEEKPCADTSTFETVLYEGNSSTQYISNVGFEPDFVWVKSRDSSGYYHNLFDSVRGATYRLFSSLTNAQDANGRLSSFDANGFSLISGGDANTSGQSMVAWCWKAGGDAVQNNDGTIQGANCLVSANQDAGFSIVKYTGNGTAGATIGHGLSAKPEFILIKNLDSALSWIAYDTNINSVGYLDLTDAFATSRLSWGFNNTDPTDTLITLGSNSAVNASSNEFIAYCFHSVSGVSKVGTYEGDGTDDFSRQITGLGFDPSFVMVKNVDSSGSNWEIIDVRRGDGQNLYANENYSENANSPTSYGTGNLITDGFAVRRGTVSTSVHWNKSGDTFIYLAFA